MVPGKKYFKQTGLVLFQNIQLTKKNKGIQKELNGV